MYRLDLDRSKQSLNAYNAGTYRGKPNVEIDRFGYRLFANMRQGSDSSSLVNLVRFIGQDYGGAQARFLDRGYLPESQAIADAIRTVLPRFWLARTQPPLQQASPDRDLLADLLAPFNASKFWIVWATKFLHFWAPATFPILDSKAEIALGLRRGADKVRYYAGFCSRIREVIMENSDLLQQLCAYDANPAPVLKVIDKVLFQEGGDRSLRAKVERSATDALIKEPATAEGRSQAALTGRVIHTWITNIASHAERAKTGDRFELCIGKEHAALFPAHGGRVELIVAGVPWRVQIGNRAGVRHLYAWTNCTSPDQARTKVTHLLKSVGLEARDEPTLHHVGRHRFELLPDGGTAANLHPTGGDSRSVD